jgi:hypothetical protein
MKKIVLIIVVALATVIIPKTSPAQAFHNGDNLLGVGIGFGSSLGGYTYGSQSPAISLQYEHGNWDVGGPGVISLGGYLGYKSFSYDYSPYNGFNYSQKWSYTIIGFRSAYHYNGITNPNWDVYGGLMLSYDILSYSYTSNNHAYDNLYNGSYAGGIGLSLYLGARYFFSPKVCGFAELGYGIAYFNLGVAFKL